MIVFFFMENLENDYMTKYNSNIFDNEHIYVPLRIKHDNR